MVWGALILAAVPSVLAAAGLYLAQQRTGFGRLRQSTQQLVIGLCFGALAVAANLWGIPSQGAVLNVRDAAPVTAGLLFGAPAGMTAACIGALHRWLFAEGDFTRLACTLGTLLAGAVAAVVRKYVLDDERPGMLLGGYVGITVEVVHMLLIFITNLGQAERAFSVVVVCSDPMVFVNGGAVAAACLALSLLAGEFPDLRGKPETRHAGKIFQFWLFLCMLAAYFITDDFSWRVQTSLAEQLAGGALTAEQTMLNRDMAAYLLNYMEVVVFAALYVVITILVKRVMVNNIDRVNHSLARITAGDLNEVVTVRATREFAALSDDINSTVDTLKRYLHEAETRLEQELEFARQIQHSALPSVFPPYPSHPEFSIYASMDTAREVGGDFYDFYLLGEDRLVFLVADVSGKGIPAALFMMNAKTLLKGLAESGLPVHEVFTRANARLCENNEAGMFVTAWMGLLELGTGRLTYANAGHNPPALRRRDGSFALLKGRPNFVLAGMEGLHYRQQELTLEPGDTLFLYTDGITEAQNAAQQLWGEARLLDSLNAHAALPVEPLCRAVMDDACAFVGGAEQFDDMTMLCLRMTPIHTAELTVEPTGQTLPRMLGFVEEQLTTLGVPVRERRRLLVAADEVCTNIVQYSQAKAARVRVTLCGDRLTLEFEDDGIPYDPTTEAPTPDLDAPAEERPVGGLGIFMVRRLMDAVTYRREGTRNLLTLAKTVTVEPQD